MEVEVAGCKKFFFARGRWCRRHYQGVGVEGAGCKNIFFARGQGCRRHYQGVGVNKVRRGQGAKPFFQFDTFF